MFQINGKTIELNYEAAGYFVYDFAAGSDGEKYGALCAIGLQEEASAIRSAREYVKELSEIRSREQVPLGDDFLGSITFQPHPLDEKIKAAEDRLGGVSAVIGTLIDAAISIRAAGNRLDKNTG